MLDVLKSARITRMKVLMTILGIMVLLNILIDGSVNKYTLLSPDVQRNINVDDNTGVLLVTYMFTTSQIIHPTGIDDDHIYTIGNSFEDKFYSSGVYEYIDKYDFVKDNVLRIRIKPKYSKNKYVEKIDSVITKNYNKSS